MLLLKLSEFPLLSLPWLSFVAAITPNNAFQPGSCAVDGVVDELRSSWLFKMYSLKMCWNKITSTLDPLFCSY